MVTAAMSLPPHDFDPRRVFRISCPTLPFAKHRRTVGIYLAGVPGQSHLLVPISLILAQFAAAFWIFVDAAVLSAHARPAQDAPHDTVPVHVSFLDWIPGILSILGLITVNLINKDRLTGEGSYGGDSLVWRARLVLFLGFAMMAGGLAGSVVCASPALPSA